EGDGLCENLGVRLGNFGGVQSTKIANRPQPRGAELLRWNLALQAFNFFFDADEFIKFKGSLKMP
ncbi:MAG: hypothetical protein FD128_2840, partial [Hyphomonadaceae bacterium]